MLPSDFCRLHHPGCLFRVADFANRIAQLHESLSGSDGEVVGRLEQSVPEALLAVVARGQPSGEGAGTNSCNHRNEDRCPDWHGASVRRGADVAPASDAVIVDTFAWIIVRL